MLYRSISCIFPLPQGQRVVAPPLWLGALVGFCFCLFFVISKFEHLGIKPPVFLASCDRRQADNPPFAIEDIVKNSRFNVINLG